MKKSFLKAIALMGLTALIFGSVVSCGKDNTEDETTIIYSNDSEDTLAVRILDDLLGDNESADKIMYDLNFFEKLSSAAITWEVVDGTAINEDGELTLTNTEEEQITISCKVGSKGNTYYYLVTVPSVTERAEEVLSVMEESMLHDVDNIRGNITLADSYTSVYGEVVTVEWTSSDTSVITDEATGDDGEIPAGVVTRGESDTNVTLTAEISLYGITKTVTYDATVIAAPAENTYTHYLYSYFRGNLGSGESQRIYLAASDDGFFWDVLNSGEYVLENTEGTGGVRDPFLLRSADGDHFWLIGTDLDASGGDWTSYSDNGSKCIVVWQSDDLVNWSEIRLIEIAGENAGCMWAPEATYDPTTGEYIVYYSSNEGGGSKQIYYVKTRDFWTFTEPQIYKAYDTVTYIDTTMTYYDGVYYRFTKNENNITILLETSDSVLGDYTLVKTVIAGEYGVEGPSIYKVGDEEKWVLYMDGYANDNSGVGYFPLIADSLEDLQTANFRRLEDDEYELPEGAKHGSFIPITDAEYEALVAAYGIGE